MHTHSTRTPLYWTKHVYPCHKHMLLLSQTYIFTSDIHAVTQTYTIHAIDTWLYRSRRNIHATHKLLCSQTYISMLFAKHGFTDLYINIHVLHTLLSQIYFSALCTYFYWARHAHIRTKNAYLYGNTHTNPPNMYTFNKLDMFDHKHMHVQNQTYPTCMPAQSNIHLTSFQWDEHAHLYTFLYSNIFTQHAHTPLLPP